LALLWVLPWSAAWGADAPASPQEKKEQAAPDKADLLLELLVKKGVLTAEDAAELRQQVEAMEAAAPPPPPPAPPVVKPPFRLNVSGLSDVWLHTQHDFFFGERKMPGAERDNNYVTQKVRLNVDVGNDDVKAVTRFDLAEGWWGEDADPLGTAFRGKGTFYDLHVDRAYLDFRLPDSQSRAQMGKLYWDLGNQIVLDSNFYGIRAQIPLKRKDTLSLGWAKIREGLPADPAGLGDDGPNADANLWLAQYQRPLRPDLSLNVYGFYYHDDSAIQGNPYLPYGLDYRLARFQPQVARLITLGANVRGHLGPWRVNGELDLLSGDDNVQNAEIDENGIVDVNNGDLSGYNLYLSADRPSGQGELGFTLGIGSGDGNPTGGRGNVNKLKTMGYFYLTEVWEDSVMPDEEGISPQGLGAPNVRGYRELDNTTILQVRYRQPLSVGKRQATALTSLSYLRATEPVPAWSVGDPDGDGVKETVVDLGRRSRDLGWELDFRVDLPLQPNLSTSLRLGYFQPGRAAQYLLNGHASDDEPAWEIKQETVFRF
jgi:hypothetical protein